MLDTNICIYIIKNKPQKVKEKLQMFGINELCISSITVSELMYGVYKSKFIDKNLKAIESFLLPFQIISYDYLASVEYGKIRADLESKGKVIGNMDMQIAGHAMALGVTLVTNNLKEFERIESLKLDNWV